MLSQLQHHTCFINTYCSRSLLFPEVNPRPHHINPPSATCFEVLPAGPRRACIKFWPTFLKIARGWRHFAKRVSVAWRREGRRVKERWVGGGVLFLEGGPGGVGSCQPLRTANRCPRIRQDSHGSAALSQWRGEIGESGYGRRREENNQWRSPPLFFVIFFLFFDRVRRTNENAPWHSAEEK